VAVLSARGSFLRLPHPIESRWWYMGVIPLPLAAGPES